jgi:thiol-disulfide isomerase/thioredoxin
MKRYCLLLVLASLLAVSACGDVGPVKRSWGEMKGLEKIVGNMNDISYSSGRTQEPRLNALEKPVSMTDFEGKFVWSEYAATWCPVCAQQTPETKRVEAELGDEIVFLTVMTGKSNAYNDHATAATAKDWARRFELDPGRVVAAELWFKTVPEHRFYSPEGHTLFVHVGYLSAEQIRDVIAYYKTGWERWAETGERAKWMAYR